MIYHTMHIGITIDFHRERKPALRAISRQCLIELQRFIPASALTMNFHSILWYYHTIRKNEVCIYHSERWRMASGIRASRCWVVASDLEIIREQLSRMEAKIDALQSDEDNSLLSVESAAKYLDTTAAAIRGIQKRRELPFKKRGRRVLFRKADLEQLLVNYPSIDSIDPLRSNRKRL